MSDDTIRKGDLVMVVRWPCCGARLGHAFRVERIEMVPAGQICAACWAQFGVLRRAFGGGRCADISWLKKINPPPIEETLTTDEEITA